MHEGIIQSGNIHYNKFTTIIEAYNEHFVEQEDEIKGAFLAILANENLLFLGPPGTAKTYLAQSICSSIGDAEFFYYLLTRFTTPEEIFGPLSLKALEEDVFQHPILSYLKKYSRQTVPS